MEGPPRFALEILPREIWEMIILEVKDSEDLQNLMKASKQSNDTFIKIHHFWLLDKVLPIIIPTTMPKLKHFLEAKDLNNLRLVDKRWSRSVNAFLENQPKLRPYNKSDDKLNSEEYIWPESCIGYYSDIFDDPELGRVTFSSYSKLSKFRRTFRNSKRNPFPARSVFGITQPDHTVYSPLEDEEKLEFWGEMDKEVFQKHGKHIWFLTMTWNRFYFQFHQSRASSVWKWIVNSLTSLPNLKGLHLEFKDLLVGKSNMSMSNSEAKKFLQLEKNQLPQMRFLESLKITRADVLPELFSYKLLSKYSMQLRRLRISTVCLKTSQNWTFPNLTELHIDEIDADYNVMQVLTSLETPLLTKLQFNCSRLQSICGDYNPLAIDILSLFPSLLHLNMPCLRFDIKECEARGPRDSNHSLKYLKIGRPIGVKYNFLSYLPNLQQLHVCSNTGVNKLFCKRRVWELCPKLRTLVETEHSLRENYKVFRREAYDRLEREAPTEPLYGNGNHRRSGRTKQTRSHNINS